MEVRSPFTNKLIDVLKLDEPSQIETKLLNATNFQKLFPLGLSIEERIQTLDQFKKKVALHRVDLIDIAISEGGKPLTDTRIELDRALAGIQLAIDHLKNQKPELIPMTSGVSLEKKSAYYVAEPIGIVFAISAFNHPINLIIHQAITAFAAGCPVLIKPDLRTPLSCPFLIKLLHEAGAPESAVQTVICDNSLAEKLATDKRINYLSFIGSAKVGWYLRSKLAAGTRCSLEHGGLAPSIILDDANLDKIIAPIMKGAFYHAGQVCVSTQRVFVPETLMNIFTDKLKTATEQLVVGDPMDEKTAVGPIISQQECDRIHQWVNDALNNNATLITGGKKTENGCYLPTVLLNPGENALISKAEIFGPVLAVYSYSTIDEAIEKANQTRYHFQASVFSSNEHSALKIASRINASAVMINNHTAFRVDWMPFGGRNESGLGIGGIGYSIDDMTAKKLIVI